MNASIAASSVPAASSACTPSTTLASAADTEAVSITVTRPGEVGGREAGRLDVPDSLPETCSETTCSRSPAGAS